MSWISVTRQEGGRNLRPGTPEWKDDNQGRDRVSADGSLYTCEPFVQKPGSQEYTRWKKPSQGHPFSQAAEAALLWKEKAKLLCNLITPPAATTPT